jgi:asparaginyl-tRNA synthetase
VGQQLLLTHGDDIELLCLKHDSGRLEDVQRWLSRPFGRISYTEAVQALQQDAKRFPESLQQLTWGDDLKHEHESWLASNVRFWPRSGFEFE